MESTHITKAVAYCRVSSQKQVTEGNGLESQRARIEEYAKIRGYDLVEIFKDDITGATAGRPAMKAMLAFLKSKREPHIVIVDDVTRLARSMATHIALREKIKAAGGILKSPSLEFGDDSDSQLIEHLLASVSQHQRQKISETTKNRMRGRMLNGYYTYRSPVGYKYQSVSGEGKVLKRDEPVASLIAEVFEGYASGRFQGPAEIMRYLEVHPAWPETRRNHMTIERVLELLNRPLYAGMIDAPARVDSQVTTLVDRIVNADSPTLIAAYEERLRALEIQKAEMRAKVADCGRPLRDFDSAYRTTMEFLENPQKLWFSNRLEDKRAVLKLAFESRIVYHRDTGYRTAVASIPFRIFNDLDENSDFESDDSEMVPRRGLASYYISCGITAT